MTFLTKKCLQSLQKITFSFLRALTGIKEIINNKNSKYLQLYSLIKIIVIGWKQFLVTFTLGICYVLKHSIKSY